MSKLSAFFGLKPDSPAAEESAVLRFPAPSEDRSADYGRSAPEPETLADIGNQLGEDNEALRNILAEAGRRIVELDEAREAFVKLLEPANRALRALEQEKSHNIGLRRTLNQTRAGYERLQAEFQDIEKKTTTLERDNERLRQELELARHSVRELENSRAEYLNEIAIKRSEIAELERLQMQEIGQARTLGEDNETLREDASAAAKRINQLESEITVSREKLMVAQGENRSLRASCDQTAGEIARASQRLAESENALTVAQVRVTHLESALAEADTERKKLTAALEEAHERQRAEHHGSTVQISALQARTSATEKLLAETRQISISRSEEARIADRQAMEAIFARNKAEKKLGELEAVHRGLESQMRDIEQSRTTLVERSGALINTLKAREQQLARAEDKIQFLTDRVARLESDMQAGRTAFEKRIEDLNLMLERERLEHSVAQGALEAARKDRGDLQRELQKLHATLRRGNRMADAPVREARESPSATGSNATPSAVQPLVAPAS